MSRQSADTSIINERRLKNIFDCLDNGNNKKALQEAEKLLKKQKDSQCARALKSLALIRLGRIDESEAILEAIFAESPVDDSTLQTMTICYRELQRLDMIVKMYENAVKKETRNEELLSHLFMAYVRMEDYKNQNIVAMKLYKLRPKTPYYFWGIMSIFMQASSGKEELSKTMYLPLAEKMIKKYMEDNELEAEAEIQLYLMVLERMEKYEEALKLLESPLKDVTSYYLDCVPLRKAELMLKLRWWDQANRAFKDLLTNTPDQWSYYLKYLDTITGLQETGWAQSEGREEGGVDHTYAMALEFVNSLIDQQHDSRQRGPYLAKIEILRRMGAQGVNIDEALVETLFMFYQLFGHKTGCYLDLAFALDTLDLPASSSALTQLFERIQTSLQSTRDPASKYPADVNEMQRNLCYSLLNLYYGKLSGDQVVQEMVDRYHHGLLFGKDLLPTDYQWSDNYCFLAVSLLLDLWKSRGSPTEPNCSSDSEAHLIQAISLLELALQHSPSNFHIKLMLVKLYNVVGACAASSSVGKTLDIKHIQQETLGYLFCQPLLSVGLLSLAGQLIVASQRFFTTNHKDTLDYLISCYKFGSFNKIPELVTFRKKLANSLHSAMVTSEQRLHELLTETQSQLDVSRILTRILAQDLQKTPVCFEDLSDNRDLSIFRPWKKGERALLSALKIQSFKEEVEWFKLRHLLVQALATMVPLSSDHHHHHNNNSLRNGELQASNGLQASPHLPSFPDTLGLIRSLLDGIDPAQLTHSYLPLQAPGPSRLVGLFRNLSSFHLVLRVLELVPYFHTLQEDSTKLEDNLEQRMKSEIVGDFNELIESFKNKHQECTSLEQMRVLLEDATHLAETYAIASLVVVGGLQPLAKRLRGGTRKSKKKNVGGGDTYECLTRLASGLAQVGLEKLVPSLRVPPLPAILAALDSLQLKISAIEDLKSGVVTKMEASYQQSMKELSDLVQGKVKLLQSL